LNVEGTLPGAVLTAMASLFEKLIGSWAPAGPFNWFGSVSRTWTRVPAGAVIRNCPLRVG
jgi:hypothetical protein